MASIFRLSSRLSRQLFSWRPFFQRPASPVRQFSQSNFPLLDSTEKLEEETLSWYSPDDFYPVKIGETWDLFQQGHLFYARDSDKKSSDGHHLAEMIAIMGPPPKEMMQGSVYATEYFDGEGIVGTSGLYVSKVILGTAGYGSSKWQDWVLEEDEALPLLEHAFRMGINTWDTADAYSNGLSEEIIGKALKKYDIPREQVVILSKIYYAIDPATQPPISESLDKTKQHLVNRVGLSRKHILSAVAESVRRLGTYIDVLQIHRLDRDVCPVEIMRALNDVVESGQARYLGASSMAAWEFQKLQYIADRHGWHQFISMQNYYNLLYREEEREMIPLCRDLGVGVLPWSPLARGVLAHKWDDRGSKREQTDKLLKVLVRGQENNPTDEEIVNRVAEVAEKRDVPMATVALAWCLKKGVYPITGLGSKHRIDQTVEAVRFHLTDQEMAYLEEPYQPKGVSY
ncbi:hypothetical protein CFD26_102717 [Aspergillus turcosus]|uniref:NADP-dependent oxidoreductase domain-containing protein n=1 Tax=Aspergillus turcosus TaxID=1245748 RepID=A0A421D5K7_9EURO|nr:hypothetical protein CFD26_102717 [Aspergillus turcosus]